MLTPALLTRMSIRPNLSATSSIIFSTSSRRVTSAAMPSCSSAARPLDDLGYPRGGFELPRVDRHIRARRGDALATRRPSPREPPVTTATLPSSRNRSENRCAISLPPRADRNSRLVPRKLPVHRTRLSHERNV